ncbi:hypothetical protein U4I94_22975, partial [Stenotrophomonas maltophilia]|uniref:hypothetical protein n=1 Tax=Stenotrophomonas maltophilia TaxID=40324 RepID=UPI002ACC78C5
MSWSKWRTIKVNVAIGQAWLSGNFPFFRSSPITCQISGRNGQAPEPNRQPLRPSRREQDGPVHR